MDRRSFLGSALALLGALVAMMLPGSSGQSRPAGGWKRASHWRRLAG
jgi:hypothetical protein